MSVNRRDWILGSVGAAAWEAIVSAQEHAHKAVAQTGPATLGYFDAATAADVAAIAEQIVPSDDGPGAKEAGVIYFIDRALQTFDSDKQDDYRKGMAEVRAKRREMFPGGEGVASLTKQQQVELMKAIEKSEFFELVRMHTLLGFLGDPSYGGNRGRVGWAYIGFEDRMSWEPPFGYYDGEQR
jgi:gluconate 2-dehydrogenase gamma chain